MSRMVSQYFFCARWSRGKSHRTCFDHHLHCCSSHSAHFALFCAEHGVRPSREIAEWSPMLSLQTWRKTFNGHKLSVSASQDFVGHCTICVLPFFCFHAYIDCSQCDLLLFVHFCCHQVYSFDTVSWPYLILRFVHITALFILFFFVDFCLQCADASGSIVFPQWWRSRWKLIDLATAWKAFSHHHRHGFGSRWRRELRWCASSLRLWNRIRLRIPINVTAAFFRTRS